MKMRCEMISFGFQFLRFFSRFSPSNRFVYRTTHSYSRLKRCYISEPAAKSTVPNGRSSSLGWDPGAATLSRTGKDTLTQKMP